MNDVHTGNYDYKLGLYLTVNFGRLGVRGLGVALVHRVSGLALLASLAIELSSQFHYVEPGLLLSHCRGS